MLEEKILQTIKKFDMLSFNDRVLIGISGGPDSVTLLQVLLSLKKRYNLSFFIAHLDHMLRGEESDEDANFVKNLAQESGLPCEVKSCNLTEIVQKEHLSIEEAARKCRYKFYSETAKKFEVNKIALGHNADDQVETVMMRFLRGSGLEGLMGIPPVRGKIIRPLIECSREEIEEYCKENKIEYRVDSSNKEIVYFRNKIRLELFPLLSEGYNKNIKDIILRLRSIISEVSVYLNQETELLFKEVARRESPETVIIDLKKFTSLPLALKRRIIRKSIEVVKGDLYSISFRHNNEILKLTEYQLGEKEIYLPDNLMVKKIYNKIMIYKKSVSKDQTERIPITWEYDILIPGKTEIKFLGIKVEIKKLDFNKEGEKMLKNNEIDEILITEEEIREKITELGKKITRDYQGKDLVFIGVLRGAVIFMSDLARAISIPMIFDFMAISSYGAATESSGVVRILKDLDESIAGKDVLIVEDIVDTGLTLDYLFKILKSRKPASLKVCTLLTKSVRRKVKARVDYLGFDIPNKFVVGYGLDYAGKFRNVPFIFTLNPKIYKGELK